ncbi:MAG: type II secretion system protein [Verrucomicrobiales bacterium]|nr:type II secretion system protein [Verrucomicrobiales bacterium]
MNKKRSAGFTLLEIIVAVSIVTILVTISIPLFSHAKARAHKAACISHLRAFHGAFSSAIQDQGHWPQPPLDEGEWDENKYFRWWIAEMEKYGVGENMWRCPGDKAAIEFEQKVSREKFFTGSYVPSNFDDSSTAPFRYNQPWVLERGTNHGRGSHVLMPDGSVSERSNPFAGR